MAGNPREHVRGKGFWEGGDPARVGNGETAGRPNGYPGVRKPGRTGVKTDIEFPDADWAGVVEPVK